MSPISAELQSFEEKSSRNGAFLSDGLTQWAWDSTSLGAFKKCPRNYYYSIVCGWQPKSRSHHLDFGIWYHGALEFYDRQKFLGVEHEKALRDAVAWAMTHTWNRTLQRGWISGDPAKNRFNLIRSLVWYLDQFAEDPLETICLANGKPAVELSFKLETGYKLAGGTTLILCGHLDRLVSFQGQTYVSDRKTTGHLLDAKYFSQFSPDNQMSLYGFAGKIIAPQSIAGIIIDAAQILVNSSRFQRQIIPQSSGMLDEWYRGLEYWLSLAEQYAQDGFWPMNEKSCFGCDFRAVCQQSPNMREEWLQGTFDKRVWDPTVSREQ